MTRGPGAVQRGSAQGVDLRGPEGVLKSEHADFFEVAHLVAVQMRRQRTGPLVAVQWVGLSKLWVQWLWGPLRLHPFKRLQRI